MPPDRFDELFGPSRGRPRRGRPKRPPGARRPLKSITKDALAQPREPDAVMSLVAELQEHQRWKVVSSADQPLVRVALASLVAGSHTAYQQRPPARSKAGREEAHVRRLALAHARIGLAHFAGERAGDWRRILATHGRQHGTLTGAALNRHQRDLAEDRTLLAAVETDVPPAP